MAILRSLALRLAHEAEHRDERHAPHAEVKGVLHPAEERPVEGAEREHGRRDQVLRPAPARLGEAARREEEGEDRDAGDDRRPAHDRQIAEADPVAEGQRERVAQAGVAAGEAVPLRPLERVAARGGAGVVEVDEDVVERRGPGAVRLPMQRPVEEERRVERAERGEDRVEDTVDPGPARGEAVEPGRRRHPAPFTRPADGRLVRDGAGLASPAPPAPYVARGND